MSHTKDDTPWRTSGVPYYLVHQADRIGVPRSAVEHPRVRDNRQLARMAGLLGQLQREYYQAPRYGDDRSFSGTQMVAIEGLLATCEAEVGKVHAIAAAGAEMIGEAYDAFGLEPPTRSFSLIAASDGPAESVAVAVPPAITGAEVASLRPGDDPEHIPSNPSPQHLRRIPAKG